MSDAPRRRKPALTNTPGHSGGSINEINETVRGSGRCPDPRRRRVRRATTIQPPPTRRPPTHPAPPMRRPTDAPTPPRRRPPTHRGHRCADDRRTSTSSPSTPTATARSCSASLPPGPPTTARYYQSVVDAAKELSDGERLRGADRRRQHPGRRCGHADWATSPSRASTSIIVGATEIAEPLPALIEQYPDIFWYCNCGAGFPENPGSGPEHRQRCRDRLHGRLRDGSAAAGQSDGDSTTFIGCCDLGFEKQSYLAYEARPAGRRPGVHDDVRPDGRLPVRLRQHRQRHGRACRRPSTKASDAVYPYLGGAHEPVVQAANESRHHHHERRFVEGL